jgi:hypothetical protein
MIIVLFLILVCSVALTIGTVMVLDATHSLWRAYETSNFDSGRSSNNPVIHGAVPEQHYDAPAGSDSHVHAEPMRPFNICAFYRGGAQ